MRELNKIRERCTNFVTSIRWDARSATILAVVLLAVALITASQISRPVQNQLDPLFPGRSLTTTELEQIEAELGASELTGYRVIGGQLHVPRQQRSKYLALLNNAGCLPESFSTPTTSEVHRGSLMETAQQRMQRLQHAKEREAELLIRRYEGIHDAYVRFDETAARGLRGQKKRTAIVTVTTEPNRPLDPNSVRMIQEFLLAAKAGLTEEDITVQDLTAGVSFRGGRTNSTLTLTQHHLEQQWKRKLATVLSFIPTTEIVVRVETDESNNLEAKLVRVSVSVPSAYLRQLDATTASGNQRTLAEIEAATRAKIQAAILPLLPAGADDPSQFVAVNFFDTPEQTAVARNSMLPILVAVLGLCLVACIGVIANLRITNTRDLKKPPPLKVYDSDRETSHVTIDEREQLQAKLRAYVDEDPDAAAKSLAEFIDRAS